MSYRNSGSERSKIRVKVPRKKYDENGNEIPHVHHHHSENKKIVKHSDGRISRKTETSTYDTGITVDPMTTSDITYEMFDKMNQKPKEKPTKVSHQRYTRDRTKVNTVGKIKHFQYDSSDEDKLFTQLDPDYEAPVIKYNNIFVGKGHFDTVTTSSASTIESAASTQEVVSRDLSTPSPDQTKEPRTSQSFTSFIGAENAQITQFTSLPDDSDNPRPRAFDKSDPFKVVDDRDTKLLYPEGRGIPTHSFDSSQYEDPFNWLYKGRVTSLNDINNDNADDNTSNNSGSFLGDAYIKGNAFSPRKSSSSSRSVKEKQRSESNTTTSTTEDVSSEYLNYNGNLQSVSSNMESLHSPEPKQRNQNVDQKLVSMTTVSELISATQGSADYVEATRSDDKRAEKYVEATKSMDSHVEMPDDELEEEDEEEDDYEDEEEDDEEDFEEEDTMRDEEI